MNVFKRAHLTVMRILDRFEYYITLAVFWLFNDFITFLYEKVFAYVFMAITYTFMLTFYLPLVIIFIPFSIAVELFNYTNKTKLKKKAKKRIQAEEESYDLINR